MSTRSSRGFITTVVLLGLFILLLAESSATTVDASANGCKKVEGRVNITSVPSGCSSPLHMCGEGTIKGDIKGQVSVATTWMGLSALLPEMPPASPLPGMSNAYVIFMTADTVFTTADGTLTSQDATTLSGLTGEYAEVITITEGTGSYAGATGTIIAAGTSSLESGSASGTYSGNICFN